MIPVISLTIGGCGIFLHQHTERISSNQATKKVAYNNVMYKAGMFSKYKTAIFFLLCLLYCAATIQMPFNFYDEGIAVVGASRVLHGEAPSRDFWTVYPFGNYSVMALLFSAFGSTVWVERIYTLVCLTALLWVMYRFLRKHCREHCTETQALVGILLALVFIGSSALWGRALLPALIFALLAIGFSLRFMVSWENRYGILAALSIIATACFRFDIGLYALFSCSGSLLFYQYVQKPAEQSQPIRWAKALLWGCMSFPLLTLLLFGVFLLLYSAIFGWGSVQPLFDQLFRFPLTQFPYERSLPIPLFMRRWAGSESIKEIFFVSFLFYSVLTVYILTAWRILTSVCKRQLSSVISPLFALLLFGMALFNQARVRADAEHIMPTLLIAILAAFVLYATSAKKMLAKASMLAFAAIVSVLPFISKVRILLPILRADAEHSYHLPQLRGVVAPDAPMYEELVQFIQQQIPEGEPFFVCNSANDRLVANDVMMYFLCNRPPATAYHEMHSGVANMAEAQQEMVQALEVKKVRLILRMECEPLPEPNGTGKRSGIKTLDAYLQNNFTPVKQLDRYTVWLRKEKQ